MAAEVSGAAVERFERTGIQLIDEAVLYWGRASLCPTAYRIGHRDDGATDWPNLIIAGGSCYALEVNPMLNLPKTYVVHGSFGMMAELQVALAQREGVDVQHVTVDDEHATVRIIRPGERDGQLFTVTMAQAVRAGWAKRNPCYQTMPQKMLPARAITTGLSAVAPGVLRGIASRVGQYAPLDLDGLHVEGISSAGAGVAISAPAPAPAGYMTHPAPDALRDEVLARLRRLSEVDPAAYADLRREWKELRGPVVQVTADNPNPHPAMLPDLLVLQYMLDETEGALAVSGVAVHDEGPTPHDVHDDAPESRGMGPDTREYAPDDPGRPF